MILMIPYSQRSLFYHEMLYDFNFFNCIGVQLLALEFNCWAQPMLKGLSQLKKDIKS